MYLGVVIQYVSSAVHLMCWKFVCYVTAAAKQTAATRDCSKKALEDGLANWFGNARDRGEGGRKNTRAEKENRRLGSE
jgi:hypothetical protein